MERKKMKFLQENNLTFHEEKYWKITRYECTLVKGIEIGGQIM